MRRVWSRRTKAALLALLRAALVIVVFHTSGIAHLAADVHEIVTTGHHAGTPFDPDDDDPGEAPGSPACHHAQPGAASLASPLVLRLGATETMRLGVNAAPQRTPISPPLQSVYRPPRA